MHPAILFQAPDPHVERIRVVEDRCPNGTWFAQWRTAHEGFLFARHIRCARVQLLQRPRDAQEVVFLIRPVQFCEILACHFAHE